MVGSDQNVFPQNKCAIAIDDFVDSDFLPWMTRDRRQQDSSENSDHKNQSHPNQLMCFPSDEKSHVPFDNFWEGCGNKYSVNQDLIQPFELTSTDAVCDNKSPTNLEYYTSKLHDLLLGLRTEISKSSQHQQHYSDGCNNLIQSVEIKDIDPFEPMPF
jgi:hypothetical protein